MRPGERFAAGLVVATCALMLIAVGVGLALGWWTA